jgi:hypothetical protein
LPTRQSAIIALASSVGFVAANARVVHVAGSCASMATRAA